MQTSTRTKLLIGTLLGALAILPRLLFAMQMDQSFHHYLGWIVSKGGLPYVDCFDQNWPMGAFIYATAILLFGTSPFGFAMFDLLVHIGTCWLIARLTLELDETGWSGLFAPLIFGLTYIGLGVWDIGQRDGFIAPMLVGAVLLAVRSLNSTSALRWLALGVLCGIMVLTRPMFILFGIPLFVYLWSERSEVSLPLDRIYRSVILGGMWPIALIILIYAIAGELATLYDATIKFNLDVYSKFRLGASFRGSGSMTLVYVVGVMLLFLFRRSKVAFFALAAAIIAPLSTWIQGQGDAHHMTPTYGVAAVLAGAGFGLLITKVKTGRPRYAIACAGLLIVWLVGWSRLPHDLIDAWRRGASLEELYPLQQRGEMDLREEVAVGKYMQVHTSPEDHVQVWSMRIWPYVLSGRTASSRFQTHEHFLMEPRGLPVKPIQLKWQREFMNDLRAKPPKIVAVTHNDHLWLMPGGQSSLQQLVRFPEFKSWLERNYKLDTVIGGFMLYQKT